MARDATGEKAYGVWIFVIGALASFVMAAVDTLNTGNGIAFTPGTYLVLASTELLLAASLLLAFYDGPRWISLTLAALSFLDVLGTGFAAWLLEAHILIACLVVALVGWLLYVVAGVSRRGSTPAFDLGAAR